ncbi:MAG: TerC family protein [Bacteroidota bacterium]
MDWTLTLIIFHLFILGMLALDLQVFHRKAHAVTMREALVWSIFWVAISLLFCFVLFIWDSHTAALEFLTGYLIEKALSVDNLFVFIVIFSYFGVPSHLQHRVLFFGILGALVMRAAFILIGALLISIFHWVLYLFGIILLFTGGKMLFGSDMDIDPGKNVVIRFCRKFFPVTADYEGQRFIVRRDKGYFITPLFLVLITIETSDIVFAVDSIPAIFAITQDTRIVYTSNIFAILGLRALYFLLAGFIKKFEYLKIGLSIVLLYVAIKMLLVDVVRIPIIVSLGGVLLILTVSVIASLRKKGRNKFSS